MNQERGIVTIFLLEGFSLTFTYPLSISVHDLIATIKTRLPFPCEPIRRWDFHRFETPTEDQETIALGEGRQL